jgi:hypothetical protein
MTHPTLRIRLYHWLQAKTQDPAQALKRFTTGGFVFCAGVMAVLLADRLIEPSLQQEVITLIGTLFIALGSVVALSGYLTLSLFRILLYLLEPSHDRSDRH